MSLQSFVAPVTTARPAGSIAIAVRERDRFGQQGDRASRPVEPEARERRAWVESLAHPSDGEDLVGVDRERVITLRVGSTMPPVPKPASSTPASS